MRPVIIVIFFGTLLISVPVVDAQTGGNNWIGGSLSFALQPLGSEDPYSGPLGIGAYYERHHVFHGLSLGGQVDFYGFYPLRSDFGDSFMVIGGVRAGYEFVFPVERRFIFSVSPYLGGRYYWRRFVYQDELYSAYRPMLALGAELDLLLPRRSLLGINLEVVLVLDKNLRLTFGQGQRIGLRF
jgi:hypothetical protein